ncbi:MAG TPA: hypothetical protein VJJ27_00950 [Candidatus Paceibacterota bacterium]
MLTGRAAAMCDIIRGMKSDPSLHAKAISLRKTGLSYNEIRKKLNNSIAKSTLSLWLKSIPLTPKHRARLYTKQIQILSRGPQSQKERRKREVDKILKEAKREIMTPLSEQTFKLFGAALYWGEGSKGNVFQVTNSDPRLILFMVNWIEKVFHIKKVSLRARLNIYPQQNEKEIKDFWSELTNIPVKNFGKSYVKPLSKGYKKNNLYYGTVRIEVPKSGDYIHRVYGWTQAVLESENAKATKVEKKWIRLTRKNRPVNLETYHP